LLVASTCDLPDVINCQFREFAAAPLGPVHFLSANQQSWIHCLIICGIQLLTRNNLGEIWRCICSLDIWSVSTLEVLRNCTLQIDIYLLTYWILLLCRQSAHRWLSRKPSGTLRQAHNSQPVPYHASWSQRADVCQQSHYMK